MQLLRNPKWLIVINTLPLLIVFGIFGDAYQIIHSQLTPSQLQNWQIYGGILALLGFSNLMYALYLIYTKQDIHRSYGIFAIFAYAIFMFFYLENEGKIIPFSIPRWMLPGDMMRYLGMFLMPTMAHGLFVLIMGYTPDPSKLKARGNLAIALMTPFLTYMFFAVFVSLWDALFWGGEQFVFFIGGVMSCTFFLFFFIRGLYILTSRKSTFWRENSILWKLPIALIFPIAGLVLNEKLAGDLIGWGLFGDFSNPLFYLIAILTGAIICQPDSQSHIGSLARFIGLSLTFSYTLYFFLVFIPFMPLGVMALLALGAGLLILTPVMLLFVHGGELLDEFNFLKQHHNPYILGSLFLLLTTMLPLTIVMSYMKDRGDLNRALDYVYEPNYFSNEKPKVRTHVLSRVLDNINDNRSTRNNVASQTPFLSPLYNALVLDRQTLSRDKIKNLKEIFLGNRRYNYRPVLDRPVAEGIGRARKVDISNVQKTSNFDEKTQTWRTWIDLEITNNRTRQGEYITEFELPEGAWISDYYLWVGDEKKMGILAEKKAALWIYRQITSEKRDPGILYYDGDKIGFKVFPFSRGEVRKTGFEIVHKEPFDFIIDEYTLTLGEENVHVFNEPIYAQNESVVYIPQNLKKQLPKSDIKPYYHFILDCSNSVSHEQGQVEEYKKQIEDIVAFNKATSQNAKVTLTSAFTKEMNLSDDWETTFLQEVNRTGFYLERAIEEILIRSDENPEIYPLIVVLTPFMKRMIIPDDFSHLKVFYPENDFFLVVNDANELVTHSLWNNSVVSNRLYQDGKPLLSWTDANNQTFLIPDDDEPSIVLNKKPNDFYFDKEQSISTWDAALQLEGLERHHKRTPENADSEWRQMVRSSFANRILTPFTSFMVVENKAQEAMLMKKQREMLNADKSFDVAGGDEVRRMSEPSWWMCLLMLLGFWYFSRRHSKKSLPQSDC